MRQEEKQEDSIDVPGLFSSHPVINAAAWSRAYPVLWNAGMWTARFKLIGSAYESEREDIVATSIGQLVRAILSQSPESTFPNYFQNRFNGFPSWSDVIDVMHIIVNRRITDFFRSKSRRPLEFVETLPDLAETAPADLELTSAELLGLVDGLQPPLPELFRDRFFSGFSTREIAERRGVNVNTVLSQFAKGFRILREQIQRLGKTSHDD